MNSRLTGILLSTVMVLFVVSYSIYTGVRYFYSPYQTETTFSYTVSDNYHTRAVAIRNEKLLSQQINPSGVLSYVKSDGSVVVPGSVIAKVYADDRQLYSQRQMAQLDNEIALLNEAQKTSTQQLLGADMIGAQVNETVGSIVDTTVRNQFEDLDATRNTIQLLLGKYRVSTGRDENFSQRISYLQRQKNQLAAELSQPIQSVNIPSGGYFCSTVDGYETILTTDFGAVSIDDYRRAINGTLKPKPVDAIGKVQQGHNWYLALVVSKNQVNRFSRGAMVSLNFNIEDCNEIPASIYQVMKDDNGDAVVILKTNYINAALINLRQVELDINFKAYTGLRISKQALRYDGQVEGVYVKNGNLITFKTIKRIYTGENFVLCADSLCSQDEDTKHKPLEQFDEVIIKGTDIYDGKIV